MRLLTIFTLLVCLTFEITAQVPPKREYRAAWLSTVINLDWPSRSGLSTEVQKQELVDMLDDLKNLNFNVILFQVRGEADALWNSQLEPWSQVLTGRQGQAPDPFYDPLEFVIEEAHKRGMELHAWFNPYRVERVTGSVPLASNNIAVQHPEWTFIVDGLRILNPGLEVARNYITDVIMEVVDNYDVDGVHFDDYFYPYSAMGNTDIAAFQADPRGFTNISDWRRDNVNIFMAQVYDEIKESKPHVKLGVSPFGVWKSGYPTGISGTSSYYQLYCDPMNWMQRGKLDYLTPQMYWAHNTGQDYRKLMLWWADSISQYNTHFYPGQAAYRIDDFSDVSEVQRQIRENRANDIAMGSTFFRVNVGILDNPRGFADSLRVDLYRNPAIPPSMEWLDNVDPNPITNLSDNLTDESGIGVLSWDEPQEASDGDKAFMYAVYKFDNNVLDPTAFENSDNLAGITGKNYIYLKPGELFNTQYYYITALDRNFNESTTIDPVAVNAPQLPELQLPANNTPAVKKDVELTWKYLPVTSAYTVEVSDDADFSEGSVVAFDNVVDTTLQPIYMDGESTYYWRVKGKNPIGETEYTDAYSFTTGYPAATELVYPAHATTDLDTFVTLKWAKKLNATSYHLFVSVNKEYADGYTVVDTVVENDTTFFIDGLLQNKVYWWKVAAINEYGEGQWSESFGFKPAIQTDVEGEENVPVVFDLLQNYPNPFNPVTTIGYSLPEKANVTIKVYDILGREVATLINDEINAGYHEIKFDASNLSSGIYIYHMNAGKYSVAKKLTVMK